jgi:hypothetical protein
MSICSTPSASAVVFVRMPATVDRLIGCIDNRTDVRLISASAWVQERPRDWRWASSAA